MHPMLIEGATRTIGEGQGYIGLPLRDILIEDAVTGPDTPVMQSAWALTEAEKAAVAAGAPLILNVHGTGHPPVSLAVGQLPADSPVDRHNLLVGAIVRMLIGDGDDSAGTLVLTESVLVGMALATIRLGGDDAVLSTLFSRASERLAEIRLGDLDAAGRA